MRQKFFEPEIQEQQETQMRGFQVSMGGTYVLLDDVVTAIRAYAQSLDDPEAGAIVHDVATWLHGGVPPAVYEDSIEALGYEPITAAVAGTRVESEPPFGAEEMDGSIDIGRVEVYPDPPDDPNPKWYARSVDTGGYILQVTAGDYNQDFVIENAQQRWPGKDIFLLKNAGEDSKWVEDGTRGVFPSQGPPVRRLWQG